MATRTVCDVCGREDRPAHRLQVGVNIEGAVKGTQSTGVTKEMDACEEHWGEAIGRMIAEVREQIERDVPIHRQVYAINDEMTALDAEVRAAVEKRDAAPQGSQEWTLAGAEVIRLTSARAEKERQRTELVRRASE